MAPRVAGAGIQFAKVGKRFTTEGKHYSRAKGAGGKGDRAAYGRIAGE
ncbi:hypothetical protein [uncultured Mediterranean phage]|nr:hypothetical protein [uncultured Mediterranean phage]